MEIYEIAKKISEPTSSTSVVQGEVNFGNPILKQDVGFKTRPFTNAEKKEAAGDLSGIEQGVFDVGKFIAPPLVRPVENFYREQRGAPLIDDGIPNEDLISGALMATPWVKAASVPAKAALSKVPNAAIKKIAQKIPFREMAAVPEKPPIPEMDTVGKFLKGGAKRIGSFAKDAIDPKTYTPLGAIGAKQSKPEYFTDLALLIAGGYKIGRDGEDLRIDIPFTDKTLYTPIPNMPIQAANALGQWQKEMNDYKYMSDDERIADLEREILDRNPLDNPTPESEREQWENFRKNAVTQNNTDAVIDAAIGIGTNQSIAKTIPMLKLAKKIPVDNVAAGILGLGAYTVGNAANEVMQHSRGKETEYGKRITRHGNAPLAFLETVGSNIVSVRDKPIKEYPVNNAINITKKGERGMNNPNREAAYKEDIAAIERAVKMGDNGKAYQLYNKMEIRLNNEPESFAEKIKDDMGTIEDMILKHKGNSVKFRTGGMQE